jgi:integrase
VNQRTQHRSPLRKLPSGRYQIIFRDANGVRHRESFDREREARAALDERRTAVRNRDYVAPAKIPTVKDAAQAWINGKKVSESKHGGHGGPIKESSIDFWQNHIDAYIVPTLGNYKLDIVDTRLVERKRDEWKKMGSLSGTTVNKIMTTLDAIFKKQLSLRTIRYNPVSVAERMARGSNEVGLDDESDISAAVRPEEVYGPDQLLRLIQSAEPGFAQTILMTLALTMVRSGELLGFMWRDIDFDKKEINIRRSWSGRYRCGEEPIFWIPKTKSFIRLVRVPDELCLALKKWKLQCPSSKWNLVFPQADGRPSHRKAVWRALNWAIKKANENKHADDKLRRLTVHRLRHSGASIHLMSGTPIPEVSAMLGHANVNITLTVYTHFVPKMHTDSAARLAAAIFKGEKTVNDGVVHLKTTSDAETVKESAGEWVLSA